MKTKAKRRTTKAPKKPPTEDAGESPKPFEPDMEKAKQHLSEALTLVGIDGLVAFGP